MKVIIDNDFDTDSGNVTSLGLLLALEALGECEIIAVGVATGLRKEAAVASAIMTYYGRSTVPIGMWKSGPLTVTAQFADEVSRSFANNYKTAIDAGTFADANVSDGVTVYRTVLAAAADNSVTIIAAGPLSLIDALLSSSADGIDARTGSALVAAKVTKLVIMGSKFPSDGGSPEYNMVKAPAAANRVAANWPTPVIWCGYEVPTAGAANGATAGMAFSRHDPSSPIGWVMNYMSTAANGRTAWDEIAIWRAVRGNSDANWTYFTQTDGAGAALNVVNSSTGANTWTAGATARTHSYIVGSMSGPNLSYKMAGATRRGLFPEPTEAYSTNRLAVASLVAYFPLSDKPWPGSSAASECCYEAKGIYHGGFPGTVNTNFRMDKPPLFPGTRAGCLKGMGTGAAGVLTLWGQLTGSAARTIAFWAVLDQQSTQTLVSWGTNSAASFSQIGLSSGNIGWLNFSADLTVSAKPYQDGQPHFIAGTYAGGAGGAMKLYIDGVEVGSTTKSLTTGSSDLAFGRSISATNPSYSFMAALEIHNAALSAADLLAAYNLGMNNIEEIVPESDDGSTALSTGVFRAR